MGTRQLEENRRLWNSPGWIQGRQSMPTVAANCRSSPQAAGNSFYLFFLQIEILCIIIDLGNRCLHTQRGNSDS